VQARSCAASCDVGYSPLAWYLFQCNGSSEPHPDPYWATCDCDPVACLSIPSYFNPTLACQQATPLEACNGIDDNCDGRIDEGCPEICGNGRDDNANGQIDEGCAEICGNGIDDNHDGRIDEGCEPVVPPDPSLGTSNPVQEMNDGCSLGDWAGSDPIQLSNRAAVTEPYTDFEVSALGRLGITRSYTSADALKVPVSPGIFGIGWHHNWEATLSCSGGGQSCNIENGLGTPLKFAAEARAYAGVGPLAGEALVLYRRSEPEAHGFGGHDLMVRRPSGQFMAFLSDGSELWFGPSSPAECPYCLNGSLDGRLRVAQVVDGAGDIARVSFSQPGSLLTLEDELGNQLRVSPSAPCPARAGAISYRSGTSGTSVNYITYKYDATCELLSRVEAVGHAPAPNKVSQIRAYDYRATARKGLLSTVFNEFNDPVVEFGYKPLGNAAAGEAESFADAASFGNVLRPSLAQDMVVSQVTSSSRMETKYDRGTGWKAVQAQSTVFNLPAWSSPPQTPIWRGRFLTCIQDQSSRRLRHFERDSHGRVLSVTDLGPPKSGTIPTCTSLPSDLDVSPRRTKYDYGVSKIVAEGVLLSLDTPTATSKRSVFTGQLSGASGARNWSYPTRESLDFDPTPKTTDPVGYACFPVGAAASGSYEQVGRSAFSAPRLRPCRKTVEGYVLGADGNPTLRLVETYLSYDARGRLVRTIGPIIGQGVRRVVGATDPVEERTFWPDEPSDPRGGRPKEVLRWPIGWPDTTKALVTQFATYDVFGPTQIVERLGLPGPTPDPTERRTILTRAGGAGRVTRIDTADGSYTRIRYYDGDKPRLVLLNGGSARRLSYDLRGRMTATERLSGDPEAPDAVVTGGWVETREYDLAGNVSLATRKDAAGVVKWKQSTTYDANHNPWKAPHPTPGKGEAEFRFIPEGLFYSEDEDWRGLILDYDEVGRPSRVKGQKWTGPPGTSRSVQYTVVADYTYELDQDLVRDVYGTEDHSVLLAHYAHDDFGRVVSVRGYTYSHDARGNVLKRTGGGRTIDYEYDGLNRLTKLTASKAIDGSAVTYRYAYDDPANPELLHTVTELDRTTTQTFDPVGRLRFEEVAEVGVNAKLTTEYRYDADGDLAIIVFPGGLTVEYVRDPISKDVTEVRNKTTGTKYAAQVKHQPGGRVTDLVFPTGETLSAGFNLRYEPTAIASGPLALSYTMTPGGNVDTAGATSFTYDAPGRLQTATPPASGFQSLEYHYFNGALNYSSFVGGAFHGWRVQAYLHDAGENLSGISRFDAGGNVIVGTTCFVHDALGRITAVGPARTVQLNSPACQSEAELSSVTVRFRYDAWNRRVARQDGTGPWKHWVATQQGQPLEELQRPAPATSQWTVLRDYVWLEGRPIAQVEYPGPAGGTEGHVYAVHTDHLGQPRALTSKARVVVWSASVARPYGEVAESLTADPASGRQVVSNLRLPGQYDERLSIYGVPGPYYNWQRWYLPSMGRYMELDPIALAGGFNGPFGPNWYGYAEGNPARYVDAKPQFAIPDRVSRSGSRGES